MLESKKKISDLQSENNKKDLTIKQMENKLKIIEEERNKYKSERDAKHEQLKLKNKTLEKTTSFYEKLKNEKESSISNFKHKI